MKRKVILSILLSIIIILSLVLINFKSDTKIMKNEIKQNNVNFISLMVEDIGTGKYYEASSFPSNEYVLNQKLSRCVNGSKIKYEDGSILVVGNKTDRCYAYLEFNRNILAEDLSGNNYYGILQNGALFKMDEEGKKGLYFDGLDDYVDIVDLPASINFADGFTIEFEAKWEKINNWSRIIDISRGECVDGILIANYATENSIKTDIRNDGRAYSGNIVTEAFELNKVTQIKLEVKKIDNSIIQNTYANNILKDTQTFNNTTEYVRNIDRTVNYLGKSCFERDTYFNGYIYNLKISNSKNEIILWYDFSN